MSIAKDEAVKLWPEPVGPESRIRVWAHENHLLRAGYEHGRTAKPTEAEVEASAIALFASVTNSNYHMTADDYSHAWESQMKEVREQFRRQSRLALEAAR